ncbi:hypothetical protein [Brevundimonas denitrificans]|uniref:hypothetical protein n=1 Tax=Brevundimonas denitrificans TaxID=1443434 RepID=UPI00223AED8D|nr:hypothetical protein [Brevundimonas denitrificans]
MTTFAADGQGLEPFAGLVEVVGVQGDVEAVLRLVDVGGPVDVHVGAHQGLVADLKPAVQQPVLHLRLDRHAGRGLAVGHGEGDLSAQDIGIEFKGLAALPAETQAGHDLHGCVSSSAGRKGGADPRRFRDRSSTRQAGGGGGREPFARLFVAVARASM